MAGTDGGDGGYCPRVLAFQSIDRITIMSVKYVVSLSLSTVFHKIARSGVTSPLQLHALFDLTIGLRPGDVERFTFAADGLIVVHVKRCNGRGLIIGYRLSIFHCDDLSGYTMLVAISLDD